MCTPLLKFKKLGISRIVAYDLVNSDRFPDIRIGKSIRVSKVIFDIWLILIKKVIRKDITICLEVIEFIILILKRTTNLWMTPNTLVKQCLLTKQVPIVV